MTTLLVDSSQLCHRAKYTSGALSVDEQDTGVVYGFLSQVKTLMNIYGPDTELVFCWDSKKSHREAMFPAYKLKRNQSKEDKSPSDRAADLSAYRQATKLRKEILPAIGLRNHAQLPGFESDDLIAKYTRNLTRVSQGEEDIVIVSSDQDMYQLLSMADMHNSQTGRRYTIKHLYRDLGVTPAEYLQAKIIAGCTTDEVPGVNGVGIPTAIKYLKGHMKESTATYKKIHAWVAGPNLERNRKLISLPFEGTVVPPIEPSFFDIIAFQDVCEELAFHSFIRQLSQWREVFNA